MLTQRTTNTSLVEDGERRGAVVTFVDITEQKKAQQALRQAKEEAEAAN
jgi:hypothetical protein